MGGVPNAPGPSPTLGSLGPSHQWCHKSRASLRGPPCAHGVAGTPQGEVRDNLGLAYVAARAQRRAWRARVCQPRMYAARASRAASTAGAAGQLSSSIVKKSCSLLGNEVAAPSNLREGASRAITTGACVCSSSQQHHGQSSESERIITSGAGTSTICNDN